MQAGHHSQNAGGTEIYSPALEIPQGKRRPRAIVIGAGIGGLATAVRLSAAGLDVVVLERQAHAGGKIRTLSSPAGPVGAGPAVLTMRHVFDDLFASAGAQLDEHVTLVRQEVIARHFWPDGSQLDLFDNFEQSAAAIRAFAGPRGEADFRRFSARTKRLFDSYAQAAMRNPTPGGWSMLRHALSDPGLIAHAGIGASLAGMLRRQFRNTQLAQMFARYATSAGGLPHRVPALTSLLFGSEAAGVWAVQGGMHKLAGALTELAIAHGTTFQLQTHVDRIETQGGRATGVVLAGGKRLGAEFVVFNGDPRALATGLLGNRLTGQGAATLDVARSLSARVYSFASQVAGPELTRNNVLFATDPHSEFDDLEAGRMPAEPTLFLCAEDRGFSVPPPAMERFEIIANAPPLDNQGRTRQQTGDQELQRWHEMILQRIAQHGTRFTPNPRRATITTPQIFNHLFPGSLGAVYGQSPHGLGAAQRRPASRCGLAGLFLTGGGVHPGAGLPMAAVSALHAAGEILRDAGATPLLAQPPARGSA